MDNQSELLNKLKKLEEENEALKNNPNGVKHNRMYMVSPQCQIQKR